MKKIGIDGRLYFQTGVGVYIRNLLYYLNKLKLKNIRFYVYLLKNDINKVKLSDNFIKRPVNSKWHTFNEQIIFLSDLLKDNLDLMHFTYFSYPIIYSKKFVSTVHDTTLFHHKTGKASTKNLLLYEIKYIMFKYIFKKQIENSSMIITPTDAVKQDIIDLFGDKISDKTHRIYEGVTYEFLNTKPLHIKNSKILDSDYLLYVGNFYPHKNIERLIDAFSQINTSYKLVLIGPDNYFSERIDNIVNQKKLINKIIVLKHVEFRELPFFYQNAKIFVHPSLSEGFGLPIIEALYFKCPIVASNIKVFKEIMQNNYISFDPYNVADIKLKIEEVIKKPIKKDNSNILIKFSFQKMASETLKIYSKLLNLNI